MRFSTCASLLAVAVVGSTSVVARRYESDSVLARDVDLELEAREEAIDYVRELSARGLDSGDVSRVVREIMTKRRDMNTLDLREVRGGRNGGDFYEPQPQGHGLTETPVRSGFEGTLGRRSGSWSKPNKQRLRRQLKKSKKIDDTDMDNSISEPINETPRLKARGGESESKSGGQARKPKPKKQMKKKQQMPKKQQHNGQDPNQTVGKKKAVKHKQGESEEEFYASLGPEEKKVETLAALADQKQNPSRRAFEGIILVARDFFDLNEELDARAPKERDFN